MAIVVIEEENEPAPKPQVVKRVTTPSPEQVELAQDLERYLAAERAAKAAYMREYRARKKGKA